MYWSVYSDVLPSFDSEITKLEYLPDKAWLISASKKKTIKIWELPREWRDAKTVAIEDKQKAQMINEKRREYLNERLEKAKLDSDDDDLTGWHLD